MGYPTSVPAFASKNTGDVVQAAHVNDLQTEVTALANGQLNGLQHALTVSTGGLTVSTGNTALGQNLSVAGQVTVPGQPRLFANQGSSQSLSSSQSTGTRIAFQTVQFDIGSGWSTSTFEYTAASSGTYLVMVELGLQAGDPTGVLAVYKNSTLNTGSLISTVYGGTHSQSLIRCDTGATLHIAAIMDSTVARGTVAQRSFLTILKVC